MSSRNTSTPSRILTGPLSWIPTQQMPTTIAASLTSGSKTFHKPGLTTNSTQLETIAAINAESYEACICRGLALGLRGTSSLKRLTSNLARPSVLA
jgi:hypothetical protein